MKFAVCNEIFKDKPIDKAFEQIAEIGYAGVEIAPWTLGASIEQIRDQHISACRRAVDAANLEVVGLHWVFGTDSPYHILKPGSETATLNVLVHTVEVCGALNGDVIVFGSPWQRNIPYEISQSEAMDRAIALIGNEKLLTALQDHDVTFCFEPLSEDQTNFVNRAVDAVALVDQINHPNVGTMLDGYSITWEEDDTNTVIRTCGERLRHFHADDETKCGPGQGNLDFGRIAKSLAAIEYSGWVSIEAHDHSADLQSLAEGWLEYLKSSWN